MKKKNSSQEKDFPEVYGTTVLVEIYLLLKLTKKVKWPSAEKQKETIVKRGWEGTQKFLWSLDCWG